MGPSTAPMAKMAMARPRSSGGKASTRMAWDMGWSPPPPIPWMMRKKISMPRLVARPHIMEAAVKTTTDNSR